jgi:hypothetical protein
VSKSNETSDYLIGLTLALIPLGLDKLGITVDVWLGALILLASAIFLYRAITLRFGSARFRRHNRLTMPHAKIKQAGSRQKRPPSLNHNTCHGGVMISTIVAFQRSPELRDTLVSLSTDAPSQEEKATTLYKQALALQRDGKADDAERLLSGIVEK